MKWNESDEQTFEKANSMANKHRTDYQIRTYHYMAVPSA